MICGLWCCLSGMSPPGQSHKNLTISNLLAPKIQPHHDTNKQASLRPFFVRLCLFLAVAGLTTAKLTSSTGLPHAREPKYPGTWRLLFDRRTKATPI